MSLANQANTPSPRDDLDKSLCDANIIVAIIGHLADGQMNEVGKPGGSLYAWLVGQLKDQLEAIEVADMAMRSARA